MAASSRFVFPYQQALDGSGNVLPGAKLYFYQTGSSTPLDTYSDAGLSVPNANPVVADADGLFGSIFLSIVANYKVVLTDSSGAIIWTADPVAPSTVQNASTSVAGIIQIATQAQALAAASSTLAMVPTTTAAAIQQGFSYSSMGGTANAPTLTLAPVPPAYASGMKVIGRATASNTGAATLNVNGLGAVAIKKRSTSGPTALTGSEIITNNVYTFTYSGPDSCFYLENAPTIGALVAIDVFTASGTWTKRTGVNSVLFVAVGEGGSGAGATSGGSAAGLASGGGAGQFAQLYKSNPASTYTITLGTGKTGASSAANGTDGTDTTVGAILTAHGGKAGVNVASGGGLSAQAGGAGGTGATGGDITIDGQAGQTASRNASGAFGYTGFGADGGSSQFGWGGRGGVTTGANQQIAGSNGSGFGAGGGGGSANGTGAGTANGGNSTGGLVIAYSYS